MTNDEIPKFVEAQIQQCTIDPNKNKNDILVFLLGIVNYKLESRRVPYDNPVYREVERIQTKMTADSTTISFLKKLVDEECDLFPKPDSKLNSLLYQILNDPRLCHLWPSVNEVQKLSNNWAAAPGPVRDEYIQQLTNQLSEDIPTICINTCTLDQIKVMNVFSFYFANNFAKSMIICNEPIAFAKQLQSLFTAWKLFGLISCVSYDSLLKIKILREIAYPVFEEGSLAKIISNKSKDYFPAWSNFENDKHGIVTTNEVSEHYPTRINEYCLIINAAAILDNQSITGFAYPTIVYSVLHPVLGRLLINRDNLMPV